MVGYSCTPKRPQRGSGVLVATTHPLQTSERAEPGGDGPDERGGADKAQVGELCEPEQVGGDGARDPGGPKV
eukprot:1194243-Prorocentrum_minimum.AAC.2